MSTERGNGNGDGDGRYGEGASARRAPPKLPTWRDSANFEDVKSVLADTLLYLHECLPEMRNELDETKGYAIAASGHAARAADAVEKLAARLDENEGAFRKKLESVPDLGEVEEVARKAGREAAESTGVHEIKQIMQAHTFEQAREIVEDHKKKRSEWRTAAIGALFALLVAIATIIVQSVVHAHP